MARNINLANGYLIAIIPQTFTCLNFKKEYKIIYLIIKIKIYAKKN